MAPMLRSSAYAITTPDQTFDHDGMIEIIGGALVLWSPGRRKVVAAYGDGMWESVTTPGYARKNVQDRPKPPPGRAP